MFRSLLTYLGMRRAPTPYGRYAAMGQFGLWPVVGYLAWRNRDKIGQFFRRAQSSLQARRNQSSTSAYGNAAHV
jgi:hypothetical protein